jgi:hypothetical protein
LQCKVLCKKFYQIILDDPNWLISLEKYPDLPTHPPVFVNGNTKWSTPSRHGQLSIFTIYTTIFFIVALAFLHPSEKIRNGSYSLCTFSPARREKPEGFRTCKPFVKAAFHFSGAAFCCYEPGFGANWFTSKF